MKLLVVGLMCLAVFAVCEVEPGDASLKSTVTFTGMAGTDAVAYDPVTRKAWIGTTGNEIIEISVDGSFTPITTTLNSTLKRPSAAVHDTAGGAAYWTTRSASTIIRFDTSTRATQSVSVTGLEFPQRSMLDESRGMIYVLAKPFGARPLVARFPTNNFTAESVVLAVIDDEPGDIEAGCIDTVNNIGVFVSSSDTPQVWLMNLNTTYNDGGTNPELYNSSLPAGSGPVKGVFCDPERKALYMYTSTPAKMIRAYYTPSNLAQAVVFNTSVDLSTNDNPVSYGVGDVAGGHAYLANQQSPGLIVHFNLETFSQVSTVQMASGTDSARGGVLDATNLEAIFSASTNAFSPTSGSVAVLTLAPPCPSNCSGRGSCSFFTCTCIQGYESDDCSTRVCPGNCYRDENHGTCNDGTCACEPDWYGNLSDCSIRSCPKLCSGDHGTCDESSFTCSCDSEWIGSDCAQAAPTPPCDELSADCETCFKNSSCGWCRSTDTCMEGDVGAPDFEGCRDWHYDTCPVVGMLVIAWLFTITAVIMLCVNIVSAAVEDYTLPEARPSDVQVRASWWRNQRSSKTWILIDRMQFIALTGQMAVNVPTAYLTFSEHFAWTNFQTFGLPWATLGEDDETSRELLSLEQHASAQRAPLDELLYGNLFWLLIVVAVIALIWLVCVLISFCTSDNFKNMARNRGVYAMLRVALMAYWGLTVSTFHQFTYVTDLSGSRGGSLAVAIIVLLFFLVGLPAGIILILMGKKAKLFKPAFRQRFSCLYHSYYFKKWFYLALVLARKAVIGLLIATMHEQEIAQIILLILVQCVYLGQLFVVKPYLDHVHMFVDFSLSILDIIVYIFMFAFIDSVDDSRAQLIVSVFIVVFHVIALIVCLAAFANSWLKLHNIHSLKQLKNAVTGKEKGSEREMK